MIVIIGITYNKTITYYFCGVVLENWDKMSNYTVVLKMPVCLLQKV